MNIVMIPLFYSETGPLSFSAFSWGRFSSPFTIFLWRESHGGWCRGWDTWWVLPGPSWGSPRLSDCWHTLEQVENCLFLVGFYQVAASSDNGLLLLLVTTYPSRECHHHFQCLVSFTLKVLLCAHNKAVALPCGTSRSLYVNTKVNRPNLKQLLGPAPRFPP